MVKNYHFRERGRKDGVRTSKETEDNEENTNYEYVSNMYMKQGRMEVSNGNVLGN